MKLEDEMLLVGDWAPGDSKVALVREGTTVLCNLEGPALPRAHSFTAAGKAGPSISSCKLPEADNRFVFSVANNHMMDYGLPGLEATLESLDQRGFLACGAGKSAHDARQPILVEDKGVRVGIIACCEAQFGVARRNSAGVAEFGPWVYGAIRELCDTAHAVIVSVHAAVEDSPWPSPYARELYRSFIDAGATVVHGHHAHVPQGYEAWGDGVIFFGMGNFAVDPDRWRDYPNAMWSLAAEVDFGPRPVCWRPLTFEIRWRPFSNAIVIEESSGEERASHRRYLERCNRPLDDPELFDALWQEVALRAFHHYGARYMGFAAAPQGGRRVQVRTGLSMLRGALLNRTARPSHRGRHDYMLWYHMVACESHREMLATALGILAGEMADLRTDETRQLADEMLPWSRVTPQSG